ncbi:MAG: hypothetical protein ABSG92_00840 [Conexivisphaerales archaeon]|jgi:hypothetical protein
MSGVPLKDSGLQGLTVLRKNTVNGVANFLNAILAQITQLILQTSITLAAVLVLTVSSCASLI